MSEPSSSPLVARRDLAIQRQGAKSACWNLIWNGWPRIRDQSSLEWNGPNAADVQVERDIMREHIEVLEHGVVMTVVTFVALRITGHSKFQPFVNSYVKPLFRLTPPPPPKISITTKAANPMDASRTNLELFKIPPIRKDAAPTFGKRSRRNKGPQIKEDSNTTVIHNKELDPATGRSFKTHLEQERDRHLERVSQAAELPHDFLVATLVGISATFFFAQPRQARIDFEEAPLLPGRSVWADVLCDDFIHVYRSTDPRAFQHEDYMDEDATLQTYEAFAKHCILRQRQIEQRRKQGADKPDVLPTPGPWEEVEGAEGGPDDGDSAEQPQLMN